MKSENYKRDIEFLIQALNEFKTKGLHTKNEFEKAAFEGIPGIDIQNTVFGILKTEDLPSHPDFRGYTKKRFWELGVETEINALEEIISFRAYSTIPVNIEGMVEVLDEHVEKIKEIPEAKRKTVAVDQSFAGRLRRAIYYYETQQAINEILPSDDSYFIEAERAVEIKEVVKDDPQSFNQIFAKRIAEKTKIDSQQSQQVAKNYTSFTVNIDEGQNLPVIDIKRVNLQTSTTELSDVLAVNPEIQQLAKLYMLPAFFADPAVVKNLIEYANKNPQGLKAALSSELRANAVEEGKVNNLVNQYIQRVNKLKPNEVVPFINTKSELIEVLPRPKPNLEKAIDKFGQNREIMKTAIQQTLKQGVLPVAPSINVKSPDIVSQAQEVLDDNLSKNVELYTTSEEGATKSALPVSGFFATPAGKSYVKTVAALAAPTVKEQTKDVDPSFASSMQIYYQLGVTSDQFKSIAKSIGFNDTETAQFLKNLRDFQSVHSFIATGGLSSTKAQRLISVFKKNNEEIYDSSEWFGNFEEAFPVTGIDGFILRAERQVLGKSASNIFSGWIEKGLAKLGNKVAESALKETLKGAATVASSAIPGIGPILSRLAVELISRFGPLLKRVGGLLAVGAAGLGGFIFLGVPGGIIAGGGTAFLVGAVDGGSFQAGVATISGGVAALGGAIAAAFVVPLLIAIISIPVVVAFILFIINSGAYVLPPAGNVSLGGGSGLTPAASCFVFEGTWDDKHKNIALQSINFLTSNAPSYINRLCKGGTIRLISTSLSIGWGYTSGRSVDFDLSRGAFGNYRDGLYILVHESGHVMAGTLPGVYIKYLDTPGLANDLVCTYPLDNKSSETFAEMIADYVASSPQSPGPPPGILSYSCLGSQTFQQKYPNHWKFVHVNLIDELLGWPDIGPGVVNF